jgi:hypothetical protein
LAGVVRVVVVGSGGSRERTEGTERTERTEGLKEGTRVVREEPRTQTTGVRFLPYLSCLYRSPDGRRTQD